MIIALLDITHLVENSAQNWQLEVRADWRDNFTRIEHQCHMEIAQFHTYITN